MSFDPIGTLKDEWPVISTAPWSVLIIVAATVVAVWIVFRFLHKQEIASAEARYKLAEERAKAAERVCREQRPTKTAFTDLDNRAIRDRALAMAGKLRQYYDEQVEAEHRAKEYEDSMAHTWGSAEDWRRRSEEKRKEQMAKIDATYQRTFAIDAIQLRDEIISRLPTLPPGGIWGPGGEYRIDISAYGQVAYVFQLESVAKHLEGLAKLLPVTGPEDLTTSTLSK